MLLVSQVEPLSPPAGTPVGELITFDGHAAQPEPAGERPKSLDTSCYHSVTVILPLFYMEPHASVVMGFAGNRASKAFDRIAEDLFSTDDKLATYKGTPFMTTKGPVTAAMKGSIS